MKTGYIFAMMQMAAGIDNMINSAIFEDYSGFKRMSVPSSKKLKKLRRNKKKRK